jgi:hypothetical protein
MPCTRTVHFPNYSTVPAISYLNTVDYVHSTYIIQPTSGPWAICSDGAATHCTTVACLETSIHFDIHTVKGSRGEVSFDSQNGKYASQ